MATREHLSPRHLALAGQNEEDVTPANRTRWRAYRCVLEAAGINPSTLTWDERPYTAAVVRQRWVEPYAADWEEFTAEVQGYPPLEQADWKPVYALKTALRRLFGLTHRRVGIDRHSCYYAVDLRLLAQQREKLNERERTTHA